MRLVIFFSIFFFSKIYSFSQSSQVRPLRIGDTVPDLSMGKFMNNAMGKTRFKDFKGKLLILIYWDSYCGSCLESFPAEERLQKEFNDSIQIVLVNPTEDDNQIKRRLKLINIKMPNVPSIFSDTLIKKLFPSKFVGSTVWIDSKGIVQVVDGVASMTNTSTKVRKLLNGTKISYVKSLSTVYDTSRSLKDIERTDSTFSPLFSATMYPFQVEYGPSGGYGKMTDTIKGITRETYINYSIVQLYLIAYRSVVTKYLSDRILGPRTWGIEDECIDLNVHDTLRYTINLKSNYTDQDFIDGNYCYEQITPVLMSNSDKVNFMQNNLNTYFINKYGTKCKIIKKRIPCYLLIRTSSLDKIKSINSFSLTQISKSDRIYNVFHNWHLKNLISGILSDSNVFSQEGFSNYLFDETNYEYKVDISFPKLDKNSSLDDFRKYLKDYDLDVIKGEKEVEMISITE